MAREGGDLEVKGQGLADVPSRLGGHMVDLA